MPETTESRVMWCSECDGDGGWPHIAGIDYVRGDIIESWNKCPACMGKGETEVQYELIDMEDLDRG